MKRFQNILCVVNPLDKNQVALERAVELAERNGARLKIVDVVESTPSWLGTLLKSHLDVVEQDRSTQLETLSLSLQDRLPAVTTEVLRGRPVIAVVFVAIHAKLKCQRAL